jgi:hypothetical protein
MLTIYENVTDFDLPKLIVGRSSKLEEPKGCFAEI